ncbi:3-carboxyethylcatechol 2,3-dioxygenase [Amycolatopsis sp.]|uniref:3-carboxyethylcatechol 2,3-dioxygenase n=1 Tax=Amycolatopsis sp. TaxID=37632 RepID=UPI002BF95BF5|nr:3-carboxyethylcatechol 2,3-dioxygenase [Amycolatopsis sp.]HVV08097.1 3-carboxyethylcatechol 2,3-dioxygenase [Amycolatopsis sp.]
MSSTLVLCASHAPGMDRDTEEALGRTFRAGVAKARATIAEFDPELVLLFGGDHRRAFKTVVPAFGVAVSASLMAEGMQQSAVLDVPGETARALSEFLLGAGFDIAVCRSIELDHAFGQPLGHYLGGVNRVPVIPMPVNCAGPPLPTAARVLDYGAAVGRFLDTLGKRVLVIGTGGLAHHPASLDNDRYDMSDDERRTLNQGSAEAARARMNPGWDKRFLAAMEAWDTPTLIKMTDTCEPVAGVGANEVRTWLAAAATAGGQGLQTVVYEPVLEWITGMGAMTSVPVAAGSAG